MSEAIKYQYDMGYTRTEFNNVIHGNFTGEHSELECLSEKQNSWTISHKNSSMIVQIEAQLQPPRTLGAISLPVLLVSFSVTSATKEQSDFFFDKFFKYFHKGGG